jgi:mannose-1-phosphate guanylyltransferase
VGRFIPPERTVVVTRAEHAPYIATELPDGPAPHVLLQPEDRGTGAAVLFAAYRIREWDPGATLAFFPSDHFILEEDAFLLHVRKIAAFVARNLERLVLLAARPTAPESDYGWVKPGTPLGESTDNPMYQVQAFLEKPQRENAERRLAAGWLWNTFAFVTSLPTLLDVGRELLPSVDARLQLIGGFARSRHEGWAIRQAYARTDSAERFLQGCPRAEALVPGRLRSSAIDVVGSRHAASGCRRGEQAAGEACVARRRALDNEHLEFRAPSPRQVLITMAPYS